MFFQDWCSSATRIMLWSMNFTTFSFLAIVHFTCIIKHRKNCCLPIFGCLHKGKFRVLFNKKICNIFSKHFIILHVVHKWISLISCLLQNYLAKVTLQPKKYINKSFVFSSTMLVEALMTLWRPYSSLSVSVRRCIVKRSCMLDNNIKSGTQM